MMIEEISRQIAKEYDDKLLSLLNGCGVAEDEIKDRCELKHDGQADIIYIDGMARIKIEETKEYNSKSISIKRRMALIGEKTND